MSKGTKKMSQYLSSLNNIQDNSLYGNVKGKVIADFTSEDSNFQKEALIAGVQKCYVINNNYFDLNDPRIVKLEGNLWNVTVSDIDVIFFDARFFLKFNHVDDVIRLLKHIQRLLTTNGILYAIFKTGNVNHAFDVYNSIIYTKSGYMPSQDYLFNEILKDFSIRILDWIPSNIPSEAIRFFRISQKKTTLLLILGKSHSGKTSIARDLISLDKHMHLSNDYIFSELVKCKNNTQENIPSSILKNLGDGGGKACYYFNRELEKDNDFLQEYLNFIKPILPRNKGIISLDLDLTESQAIEFVKEFFKKNNFSIWCVMR